MNAASFYQQLAAENQMLEEHGFESWPDNDELTRKVCDLEDGLHALARSLGCEITKDYRDRWIVFSASKDNGRNG